MPEGDTVLRTARRLHQALAGRPLVRAELRWPTLGEADLAGRTVTEVVAYGKQILTRIAAADPDAPQPRIPTVAVGSADPALAPADGGPLVHPRPGRRAVADARTGPASGRCSAAPNGPRSAPGWACST